MIGLITVGEQSMADRYAYIPYIGLFIAVVWAADAVASRLQISVMWRASAAIVVVLVLGSLTSRQVAYWHDDETLWRYTLSVTKGNYMAHNNLAILLAKQRRTEEAVVEFQAAKSLHKYEAAQILTLALYELRMGYPQQAIEDCDSVLRETTDTKVQSVAWSERGQAQLLLHHFDQADQSYSAALRLGPENELALIGSGLIALRQGRAETAADQWAHAAKLEPSPVNFLLLAHALRQAGRVAEAESASAQAKKIAPDLSEPQTAAAQILSQAGVVPIG
jgi:tetratricopeptide (TPR) repeat protein